ncbi:MAG: cold-shock protein [Chitinispirillaceae bacterium]|nr:cold-shock protein [Chitinispirillaceae bacterium]
MTTGTVIFFNDITGSGFIFPDKGPDKIAVSYREIKKSGYKILQEGQRVRFELAKSPKGTIIAVNVKILMK